MAAIYKKLSNRPLGDIMYRAATLAAALVVLATVAFL